MQRSTASSAPAALVRTRGALGRRENWLQLIRFCLVGASGYVVNLAVYTLLLKVVGVHYLLAATGSFLVAVTNNYTWNRLWTFRGQRGHVAYQGLRFLVVSTIALAANLAILALLVGPHEAEETVFLFVRDKVSQVTRPLLELKGYAKLRLRPGDAGAVGLELPAAELRYLGPDLQPLFEAGEVEVLVGPSAEPSGLLRQTIELC